MIGPTITIASVSANVRNKIIYKNLKSKHENWQQVFYFQKYINFYFLADYLEILPTKNRAIESGQMHVREITEHKSCQQNYYAGKRSCIPKLQRAS